MLKNSITKQQHYMKISIVENSDNKLLILSNLNTIYYK